MRKLIEFYETYATYRLVHSRWYAAKVAYGIAFKGVPF